MYLIVPGNSKVLLNKGLNCPENLFRYMDECYGSGSPLIIERGRERFVLKPQGSRKPVGSISPRPWIAPDLDSLPSFPPSVIVEIEGWVRCPEIAATLGWTSEPFDRLITAHALAWAAPLLTRDGTIRDNYRHAFWDEPPVY